VNPCTLCSLINAVKQTERINGDRTSDSRAMKRHLINSLCSIMVKLRDSGEGGCMLELDWMLNVFYSRL
jgi:hypothetical protein